MDNPYQEKLESDQTAPSVVFVRGDYPITSQKDKWETILGYRRYKDFDVSNSKGQDFAIVSHNNEFIIGIVADGVSQSFFGHIAADLVSNKFHDFLWDHTAHFPDEATTLEYLKTIIPSAQTLINEINLEKYPNILRKALEEAKKEGSQTVFSAFILNVATHKAVIYSVGDIETFIYQKEKSEYKEKKINSNNPNGRWSSVGKSDLHLTVTHLNSISGIIMYSDGLKSGNNIDWGRNFNADKLNGFKELAEDQARQDDVSLVCAIPHSFFGKSIKTQFNFENIPVFRAPVTKLPVKPIKQDVESVSPSINTFVQKKPIVQTKLKSHLTDSKHNNYSRILTLLTILLVIFLSSFVLLVFWSEPEPKKKNSSETNEIDINRHVFSSNSVVSDNKIQSNKAESNDLEATANTSSNAQPEKSETRIAEKSQNPNAPTFSKQPKIYDAQPVTSESLTPLTTTKSDSEKTIPPNQDVSPEILPTKSETPKTEPSKSPAPIQKESRH